MRPTYNDLTEYLELGKAAAIAAGDYIKEVRPEEIDIKVNEFDLVTECDKEAERIIRSYLSPTKINILGEEFGGDTNLDFTWTIDPIDGTYNFIKGSPLVGVNIALIIDEMPEIAVTYLPFLNEIYTSKRGDGVFFNDILLRGFDGGRELSVGDSSDRSRNRILGAASVELAWFARGIFTDIRYEISKPWDVAPGILFTSELGGSVSSRGSIYWDDVKFSNNLIGADVNSK